MSSNILYLIKLFGQARADLRSTRTALCLSSDHRRARFRTDSWSLRAQFVTSPDKLPRCEQNPTPQKHVRG